MFNEIVLINFKRPLRERADTRKHCGPYRWRPSKPGSGRGFYQASRGGLRMDERGSSLDLRLSYASEFLSRWRGATAYWCDEFGDTTLTPIVAHLPSGRGFLAGYTMGAGMAASLEPERYDTPEDAARAAHDAAERAAERERDYQAAWQELARAKDHADTAREEAREALGGMRECPDADYPRRMFRASWRSYRKAMEKLADVAASARPYGVTLAHF